MVVKRPPEVNPPSGRVPGRGLLVLLILEARRRRNRGENRDAGLSPRVFGARGKNRPKGGTRGWPLLPGALLARPGVGPRPLAAWEGGGPPLAGLRASGSFRYADFLYIFLGIFWAL